MKKILLFLIVSFLFVSCNKPFKIAKSEVDTYNEKVLNEVKLNTYYGSGFEPVFINSRFLELEMDIVNASGQTLEKLVIHPSLKISFKNDLNYILPLNSDTIILNIDPGGKLSYEKVFSLDSLQHFKEEILLHKAEKAVLIFEIKGKNSIGYISDENEIFTYEKILTAEWNYLYDFYKRGKFKNATEVFVNYTKQLNNSLKNFNDWNNEYSIQMIRSFEGNSSALDSATVRGSTINLTNFNEYQDVLLSNFLEDLKSTKSITPDIESTINKFKSSKKEMWNSRVKMDSELLTLFKFKDSLNNLNPYPPRFSYTTSGKLDNREAQMKIYNERQQILNQFTPPFRDSLHQRALRHQVEFEFYNAEALGHYSKFHDLMVEILKIDDFVKNYEYF